MQELMIPILAFLSVVSIGGAVMVARLSRRRALAARLAMGESLYDTSDRVDVSARQRRLMDMLQRTGKAVSAKGPSASLRALMTKAGYHGFLSAEIYLGAKIVLFFVTLVAVAAFVMPMEAKLGVKVMGIFSAAALMSFMPNIVVAMRRQKRSSETRAALPDAIDLMEICVSAGMGIDMAWNAVGQEVRRVSNVLADEMALTNLEIHLGTARGEAMKHMAERTDADELASLAGVLSQSEQFGTSVSDALKTYAASMRELRNQRAEECAEKMAVKLLIPMVLFIFPAIIVVCAGPACVKLTALFGG